MDLTSAGLVTSLGSGFLLVFIVIISLSVHEFAHSLVAYAYGDPTAKNAGRMTINPIAHWDPVGTTLLVALLLGRVIGLPLPVFGWGKPVPVDEGNFEKPALYGLQVSLSGPLSNFFLAALCALVYRFVPLNEVVLGVFSTAIYLNLFLMFFNLLPVPPLDGSSILRFVLPESLYNSIFRNPTFYLILLFIVLFFLIDFVGSLTSNLYTILIGIR